MRRPERFLATIGALLLVSGCSLAPKYARPEAPVPPALPSAGAAAPGEEVPAAAPWREFVADGRLRSVIEMTLANNRDLRTAVLNAERVGAYYRIQRAELYPSIGASAGVQVAHVPDSVAGEGEAYTSHPYTLGVGLTSWEIDLFGRIRSLKEQALNEYLAAQQVAAATQTSLIAASAATYLSLAADAENRSLSEDTLRAQRETLGMIQKSRDAGVASDLDVRQAQTQVETARALLARYTGLVELDRHELELLAGRPIPPELLPEGLGAVEPMKGVAAGMSSEVLLRRPDIMAAEFQLKGVNASIGAARAALFPRISLTAAIGLVSPDLSGLFSGSGAWSLAPQLTAPIFNSGALKANVEATRLARDAAVAQYEKAIQSAFREASDALVLRATLAEQRDAEAALVRALEETYRLSEARYKAGIDGYLGVLVAQRSLFLAQQGLVGVRLAEQQNLVNLYKVLGGGVS
ncbi:MAG: multidrug transporter [Acidobacteria bacterium]|nr:multidrug transporter [Acidobacteriota bacterium]